METCDKIFPNSVPRYRSLRLSGNSTRREHEQVLKHITTQARVQAAHMKLRTKTGHRRKGKAWRKILSDVDDTLTCSGRNASEALFISALCLRIFCLGRVLRMCVRNFGSCLFYFPPYTSFHLSSAIRVVTCFLLIAFFSLSQATIQSARLLASSGFS